MSAYALAYRSTMSIPKLYASNFFAFSIFMIIYIFQKIASSLEHDSLQEKIIFCHYFSKHMQTLLL